MTRQLKPVAPAYLGYARSMLGEQRCDGNAIESVNWNVNGQDLYPQTLENPSFQYDELSKALNRDLDVERPMYWNDENAQWGCSSGFHSNLNGTYKPLGVDLRNGEPTIVGGGTMIGQYPIVCKYSRTPVDSTTGDNAFIYKNTIYAQDVDFHVMASRRCVVKSGVKGNDVVVSY